MPFAPKPVAPPRRPPAPPRPSSSARGYGPEHRAMRELVIREQGGVCGWCQDAFATDLHHIDRNTFNRDRSNLVALCERCHHADAHGGR